MCIRDSTSVVGGKPIHPVTSIPGGQSKTLSLSLIHICIVGIAVGFAARDTISNFIAGLFVLGDKSFKVGDIIAVSYTHLDVYKRQNIFPIKFSYSRFD